jgi:hypothetical protein
MRLRIVRVTGGSMVKRMPGESRVVRDIREQRGQQQ